MSGPYLHGHHASVLRSHSWRTVENSAPHLIPYLTASIRILDVGCGPGTITTDLASRVPQGFVLGIDPSASVIEKAKKHAEEKGVTNVRFEVGDIFKMGGEGEDKWDVVHAHQVLQHLQDPLGAMKQMIKLTKPGGIIAVRDVDYSLMDWYPNIEGLQEWQDLYIAVAQGLNADPNIGKRLHAVAMEAGVPRKDIETSTANWTFSTVEELEWWCELWADRIVQSDFKDKAVEGGHAKIDDLERLSKAFRTLEKREDGWFVVVHGQIIVHIK
ncbi:methyltransferase UbiE [Amniculicola lignicola CBS 123094]|uniref:Methyltransferase UbiE n=1 Tax=Amniculicola lignicola CBS 123094 TaxID=1392246 RepID=A0A6A5X3D9_9PLEO|nr:methyltransferase UbiE [Amniculicola lignicola CBS 123094]